MKRVRLDIIERLTDEEGPIILGTVLFFSHYHEGQASEKYRRLSRMSRYFKPSPLLSVEALTENGREIYDALTCKEEAAA